MSVDYEWCREYVDKHDDILDHDHGDKLMDIQNDRDVRGSVGSRVALIRNQGNDEDGLSERGYAYPTGGSMPLTFDCDHNVPIMFLREWNKFNNKIDL